MYLSDIKVGDKVKILKVDADKLIKRRLQDIGLFENTNVECVLKSSFGSTFAYLIKGALIAIRREDISKIEVELL